MEMLLVLGRYTMAINRDEETAARAINNQTAYWGFRLCHFDEEASFASKRID